MELGNLCFGNARGEHAVPRDKEYENSIYALIEHLNYDVSPLGRAYVREFENDVFKIFPYHWGDCTCGYEDDECDWFDANPHTGDCYQSDLARARKFLDRNDNYAQYRKAENAMYRSLCQRHGITWNDGSGCAVHCTCGRDARFSEWSTGRYHKDDCPIVIPNFHHKPSGYKLKWYKYPLRDSYANAALSPEQFRAIMGECIASLASKP